MASRVSPSASDQRIGADVDREPDAQEDPQPAADNVFYNYEVCDDRTQTVLLCQTYGEQARWRAVVELLMDKGIDMSMKWLVCGEATGYRTIVNLNALVPRGPWVRRRGRLHYDTSIVLMDFSDRLRHVRTAMLHICPLCGIRRHVYKLPPRFFRFGVPPEITACYLCGGPDWDRWRDGYVRFSYTVETIDVCNEHLREWGESPHRPPRETYDSSWMQQQAIM